MPIRESSRGPQNQPNQMQKEKEKAFKKNKSPVCQKRFVTETYHQSTSEGETRDENREDTFTRKLTTI